MTSPVNPTQLLKVLLDQGQYEYEGDFTSRRDLRTMSHRVKLQLPVGKSIKTWSKGDKMYISVVSAEEASTRTVSKKPSTSTPKTERRSKTTTDAKPGFSHLVPTDDPNGRYKQRLHEAMTEAGVTNAWNLDKAVRDRLDEDLRKEWVFYGGISNAPSFKAAQNTLIELRVLRGEIERPVPEAIHEDDEAVPEAASA